MTVDRIRSFIETNENLREAFADTQERAIPAEAGDKMRDIILALCDMVAAADNLSKMEATYRAMHDKFGDWDRMRNAGNYYRELAATLDSKVNEILGKEEE